MLKKIKKVSKNPDLSNSKDSQQNDIEQKNITSDMKKYQKEYRE